MTSLKHRKRKRFDQEDWAFSISTRISCNTQEMSESCILSEIKWSAFVETLPIKFLIIRILNYDLKGNRVFSDWSVSGGQKPDNHHMGNVKGTSECLLQW